MKLLLMFGRYLNDGCKNSAAKWCRRAEMISLDAGEVDHGLLSKFFIKDFSPS